MLSVALGFVVGVLAVRLLVIGGESWLRTVMPARTNHAGRLVPSAAGVFVVLVIVLVEGGRTFLAAAGLGHPQGHNLARLLVLLACVGFGFLGLVDDLGDGSDARGVRGHAVALARGRLTSGVVKAVGGLCIAAALVANAGRLVSHGNLALDALVVALAANVSNLFDRAPGRAVKVGVLAWIAVAAVARGDVVGVAIAPVMGAFVGLLGDDLHEHFMLGDVGANVLGAVLGLAVVLDTGTGPRVGVLVVLLALTAAAEFVSFSRVIARVPALGWFDRLGRRDGR